MSSNSTAQMLTSKYYKHLIFRETPYAPIKGRNPISEEMAKSENHYKLTYDASKKLLKVEYRFGEQIIDPRRCGFMDGYTDLAPVVKIEYENNFEIRSFYNESGKQEANFMGAYKAVFEYDKKGRRLGLKYFDKEGRRTNNSWGIFEYQWKHIDELSVLEKRKDVLGEFVPIRPYYLFMNVVYTYHSNGLLARMENVDSTGNLTEEITGTAIDEPIYDDEFQLIGFKFYDKNKENIIGSFYGAAGGGIVYDEKGNTINYYTIDLDGKPMAGAKNWAIIKCVFDKFGNEIEQTYFDGKSISVTRKGFTKIQMVFDEKNPNVKLKTINYHQ